METVAIGLLGMGTVGSAVAEAIRRDGQRIARRAGVRPVLRRVLVRDAMKTRASTVPFDLLTTDPRRVLDDPEIAVVIELIGGTEPALSLVRGALAAGKHVVTANKALLAERGAEVFDAMRRAGRAVAFEGAVAGGVPIVQALGVALAANRFDSLAAILNGTCNFILTAMAEEGLSYDDALGRARALGFAEADPTLDVDGTDTAHKLAILAQLAFGASVTGRVIPRIGIDHLQPADIRFAAELGYAVKLLAVARDHGDEGLELRVAPTLVRGGTPMADVAGPYNAIRVVGRPIGDAFFYGRGAGAEATASAVVGDLIDVLVGRAERTARALDLWPEGASTPRLCGPGAVRSRYYLRFVIADRPGVIGAVAQVLGAHGVSIASVIQHDPGDGDPEARVSLVFMTHVAAEAAIHEALAEVDRLEPVQPPSVCLGVAE